MSDGQTPQHGDPYTSRPVGQNPFEQAHTQAHTQALPAQQPAEAAAPRRRRTGIAAAVVATSLVVGAGAGIGGAAWWDSTQDEPAASAEADPVSTSQVSQTDAPPSRARSSRWRRRCCRAW